MSGDDEMALFVDFVGVLGLLTNVEDGLTGCVLEGSDNKSEVRGSSMLLRPLSIGSRKDISRLRLFQTL